MQITNLTSLNSDRFLSIEEELAGQCSLLDVLAWARLLPPGTFHPRIIAEVVAQDEYTHDVIVPWRDGLVLVYDTN
jgi:hypothetical protein